MKRSALLLCLLIVCTLTTRSPDKGPTVLLQVIVPTYRSSQMGVMTLHTEAELARLKEVHNEK